MSILKGKASQNEEITRTVFGPETYFEGTLKYETSLKIMGKFKGTIETEGLLIIEENAEVDADVKVGDIIIKGCLKGNIEALNITKMLPTSKIYGDIRTGKVKIETGAKWEGRIEMTENNNKDDL